VKYATNLLNISLIYEKINYPPSRLQSSEMISPPHSVVFPYNSSVPLRLSTYTKFAMVTCSVCFPCNTGPALFQALYFNFRAKCGMSCWSKIAIGFKRHTPYQQGRHLEGGRGANEFKNSDIFVFFIKYCFFSYFAPPPKSRSIFCPPGN